MIRTPLLAIALLASYAQATLTYQVDVKPDANSLHVTLRIPKTSKGAALRLPCWAPGAYVVRDTSASVKNLKAVDGAGNALAIEAKSEVIRKEYQEGAGKKTAERTLVTWHVAPAPDTVVEYDIDLRLNDGAMHWSGPSTYLYEVNRLREKCVLDVRVPSGWPVYTGLDEQKPGSTVYVAPDYDTLADNPVSTGNLLVDTYTSRGRPHFIVMRNPAKSQVDRAKLIAACKLMSDMQTDFFGGAPYRKYVWHFAVNPGADGAGGLEHLSSTQISLAAGVGPRAVSVLSHEFFHLWNVKRIRSRPLGPFDYTRLPETGALWWLEGTTDYYAHTLLYRYGAADRAAYYADINGNYQTVLRTPAWAEVGAHESSLRVGEASGGRGNSNGYRISYYNLGWLAGMCLDIEIRAQTGNKRSLDDVTRALWQMCRSGKPGFAEDEIRKQCVRFGGPAMGPIYDRIVMQPAMPVIETLAKVGLTVETTSETVPDPGFSWTTRGTGSVLLTEIHGPAEGKLERGDIAVAVNGKALEGATGRELNQAMATAMRAVSVGTPLRVSVKRGETTTDVEITPVAVQRSLTRVRESDAATAEQKALREAWLATRTLKPGA